MIIFEYRTIPAEPILRVHEKTFFVKITDDLVGNVITYFFGKEYCHTLPKSEIQRIIRVINNYPELLIIDKLEPNETALNDYKYYFTFNNGKKLAHFSGIDILDYGRQPRKKATLALRAARDIKEILDENKIRTMISSRLQHWPRIRYESELIKL